MKDAVLAVDLGGTKVLIQLSTLDGSIVCEQCYMSNQFVDFDAILTVFFDMSIVADYELKASCIAVAGPVINQTAAITNLPWKINTAFLAARFPLGIVLLCNDFEAVAFGIDGLDSSALITLQTGKIDSHAPRAIIGAGTGLGQAFMFAKESGWDVVGTEGGNVDFAPTDDEQIALWSYLNQKFGHVSYERILSGSGLVSIYAFLAKQQTQVLSGDIEALINSDEAPGLISQLASSGEWLADRALHLFMRIYGAQAGNLALSTLARGGLYIQQGPFIEAFLAKGKMAGLMPLMPVILITDETVGLSGARYLAMQSAL
jgi:glucokinase